MRRVLLGLLTLAFIGMANLHLPLLQVCAWTGMIISYSRDVPLAEAIEMTFDGDHPCPLCCAIKKEQTQPRQELVAQSAPERTLLYVESAFVWRQSLQIFHDAVPRCGFPSAHAERPPVPPPRTAA
jgi:hypothetical protein